MLGIKAGSLQYCLTSGIKMKEGYSCGIWYASVNTKMFLFKI